MNILRSGCGLPTRGRSVFYEAGEKKVTIREIGGQIRVIQPKIGAIEYNKDSVMCGKGTLLIGGIVVAVAGLLDIKYKGLFYKSLPQSLQTRLDKIVK